MPRRARLGAIAAAAIGTLAVAIPVASSSAHGQRRNDGEYHHRGIGHVLLISVDGMHQSDLDWYVATHPNSELARLAGGGLQYTNNHTSDPSDSDPGGTALMTGGDPRATGIYYDDEYSHGVFPPGTTSCSGPVPGGDVIYDSPDDTLPAVPDLLNNSSGIYKNGIDKNPGLRPRRPTRRLRAWRRPPRPSRSMGRDDPGCADDPAATRARPESAPGGADRAHPGIARDPVSLAHLGP